MKPLKLALLIAFCVSLTSCTYDNKAQGPYRCDGQGKCLPGYVCEKEICVPEMLDGGPEDGGVIDGGVEDGGAAEDGGPVEDGGPRHGWMSGGGYTFKYGYLSSGDAASQGAGFQLKSQIGQPNSITSDADGGMRGGGYLFITDFFSIP